jgi:hypothetical protein
MSLARYTRHTRCPVAKLAKGNGIQDDVIVVEGLDGDQDLGGGVLLMVERRGVGVELPATVDGIGKLANLCGDRLVADDETDIHCICEFWTEMDADSDGGTALALCWSIAEDMNDACWRDDGVAGICVWNCGGRHAGRSEEREGQQKEMTIDLGLYWVMRLHR